MSKNNLKTCLATMTLCGFAALGSACSTSEASGDGDVASERECRSFEQPGTKMRESVCRSKEQWAIVDAGNAERNNREELVDEFFRRQGELGAQGQGPAFDTP
jgi:hypothetical protein